VEVQDLAARVSLRVAASCRFEPFADAGELPRIPGRDQIDADRLLARLEDEPIEPGAVRVGLVGLDIAIPIFTFVFGRARSGGHAAVVSTARLDPAFYGLPSDAALMARRTVDEVLHELGHVAGLPHCVLPDCLMHFAGTVEQVDVRGSEFCPGCAARLPLASAAAPRSFSTTERTRASGDEF
jgi:archaemetzincin